MTSRDECEDCQRHRATIDRLALELAREHAARSRAEERADRMERRARTWRRVAQWIHAAHQHPEDD